VEDGKECFGLLWQIKGTIKLERNQFPTKKNIDERGGIFGNLPQRLGKFFHLDVRGFEEAFSGWGIIPAGIEPGEGRKTVVDGFGTKPA